MDKGPDWLSQLTTADGEVLQFDPSLLEEDAKPERSSGCSEDEDDVDGGSERSRVDPDLYDELGRTPPRMSMAKQEVVGGQEAHQGDGEKGNPEDAWRSVDSARWPGKLPASSGRQGGATKDQQEGAEED